MKETPFKIHGNQMVTRDFSQYIQAYIISYSFTSA